MNAHAELNYFADRRDSRRDPRQLLRNVDLNWYQIAVVAVATFAVAMDLLFPPVRAVTGAGLDVFVGHVFVPLSTMKLGSLQPSTAIRHVLSSKRRTFSAL